MWPTILVGFIVVRAVTPLWAVVFWPETSFVNKALNNNTYNVTILQRVGNAEQHTMGTEVEIDFSLAREG